MDEAITAKLSEAIDNYSTIYHGQEKNNFSAEKSELFCT